MIQDVNKFWLPFVPAIVVGIGKGDFTGAPHQVLQVLHQTKQVLIKSGSQQKHEIIKSYTKQSRFHLET